MKHNPELFLKSKLKIFFQVLILAAALTEIFSKLLLGDFRSQLSNNETFPVAKVAELKKLKTCSNERPVLGCELESGGVSISFPLLQQCSLLSSKTCICYKHKCGEFTTVDKFSIKYGIC